ncbi:MAG: hypothetical protein LLG00_07430 [Planctomycetaceae bacterium]|nr:hypothetical protein [Planctomycetaceae bacterium]
MILPACGIECHVEAGFTCHLPLAGRRTGGHNGRVDNDLTLIGLDIEGKWNVPLLENAAAMSRASLLFAASAGSTGAAAQGSSELGELLGGFDHVVACELTPRSRPVYDYPTPRGRMGIVVGNEQHGVPAEVLKKVEAVLSVPMVGRGLSSINVAAAAAVILYAVERGLGRRRFRRWSLAQNDVDLLIVSPPDPSELGSLLRSAWAFGWRRVFVADRNGVWFSKDRATVLAGRAAARSEVNRIVVNRDDQLRIEDYDQIIACGTERQGTALSRLSQPRGRKVLVVFGNASGMLTSAKSVEQVYVDHAVAAVTGCFRHLGSVLLSVVSQHLERGRRG